MRALFLQPPVYDFTCHDFWLKPYGLVKLAGLFRQGGWDIYYFDFLDRFQDDVPKDFQRSDPWGRGKFPHIVVEKPSVFSAIPRYFKRFGREREVFQDFLARLPSIDMVFLTVPMTYWVRGVEEVIPYFQGLPLYAGGMAPTVFPEWFEERGIIPVGFSGFMDFLSSMGFSWEDYDGAVPAWDFYPHLPYVVVRLSYGCPLSCTYCALPVYSPLFKKRSWKTVFEELKQALRSETKHLVFYDDALLSCKDALQTLQSRGLFSSLSLHTPNGLWTKSITPETAKVLFTCGFTSCYLGVETTDDILHRQWGKKTEKASIIQAINLLKAAGFSKSSLFGYILWGHPDTTPEGVKRTVREVRKLGIQPRLADFSPIPGTPDGNRAYPSRPTDPLLTNKTYHLYQWASPDTLSAIKKEAYG